MSPAVLLVGAGPMAIAYHEVLAALGRPVQVIGRGVDSATRFTGATGVPVVLGGVDAWLARGHPPVPAIVATSIRELGGTVTQLLAGGVRDVLVEKPAGIDADEIAEVARRAQAASARVCVAYNRRFYASSTRARELIEADGGVSSFSFEFTELADAVSSSMHPPEVKRAWLLANSTHVIDLAFHLGGRPATLAPRVAGSLPWHPAAARFAGTGTTEEGALFSFRADWDAPGRWGLELMTRRRRLVLQPMERLQVQERNSFATVPEGLDDALDRRFKPGLYRQVEAFLSHQGDGPPSIAEHATAARAVYARIVAGR